MKHIPLVAILLISVLPSIFAQDISTESLNTRGLSTNSAPKNYLKLYLSFDLAQRYALEQIALGEPELSFRLDYATEPFYALAFAREFAGGNFWEISGQTNAYAGGRRTVYRLDTQVDSFPFSPADILGGVRNNYAHLQYEYNWLLSGDIPRKVRPYLGIFLRGAAQWASFEPTTSANFSMERWRAVLAPGFIPRLFIFTGKRLHIDFSAPVVLGYFGLDSAANKDPMLTSRQQRATSFDLSMVTLETTVRFGLVYQLGKRVSE